MKMTSIIKNILPAIVDNQTKVLILGSMPGEVSLVKQQYYGNERNHFWRIISTLFEQEIPSDYEGKIYLAKQHEIGLWDVIQCCERQGSLDSAIKKEVPNNLPALFERYQQIELVVFNGGKAYTTFKKYFKMSDFPQIRFVKMPSTSPVPGRNVKSFDGKLVCWSEILTNQK